MQRPITVVPNPRQQPQGHAVPGQAPGWGSASHVAAMPVGQGRTEPAPPRPRAPSLAPAPTAAKAPQKPNLVSKLTRAGKALAVGLVVVGGYLGYMKYQQRQPYEWSGSVEVRTVSVGSRVGGRVKSVAVREGAQVNAGDVLVILEPGELQAKRVIAQGDVEAAQAALDRLANGARPEEIAQALARVNVERASLAQAVGHADFMDREFARTEKLFAQRAASAVERDAALGQARSGKGGIVMAGAHVREAEAALKLVTSGTRPEEFRAARAQVDVARAKLALVDAQLDELTIRAPNKARVETVAIRPGDILRADARAVSLLEKGEIYVRIYIPETRLAKVAVGQEVPVSVDSFPNRTFRGRVEHINEVGEFTPRRLITTEERADEVFAARIVLLEGEADLKAGMAAFIHVKK